MRRRYSATILFIFALLSVIPLRAQLSVPDGRRIRDIVDEKHPDGEFLVGATTGSWAFGQSVAKVMDREYSYVTPENDFKQSVIRADPNAWNWSRADAWIQHIIDNGQVLRMHGPISPQCSQWAREDDRTAAELAAELDTFMTALCMRYNGVQGIEYLDVVNEIALDDGSWFGPKNGTDSWENPWTRIGYDSDPMHTPLYIRQAFAIANEHAPDLKLMVNNHCQPGSAGMEKVKSTILYLRDLGYRVDAMGWQAHVDVGWEKESNLQALAGVIDWCNANDVEFHITEFDAFIAGQYYPTFEMQANTYKAILDVMLRKMGDLPMGWNMWQVSDAVGWMTEKRPAAFDADYQAKPAYYAMQLALETGADYDTPFQVSFLLEEEESGLPLGDCSFEINGEDYVSGADGLIVPESLTAARYPVTARAVHRDTLEKMVSIYRDTVITLSLKQAGYDVDFNVRDSYTGNPLSGVRISMNQQEQVTDNQGIVRFSVPVGNYPVSFDREGYATISRDYQVDRNSSFEVAMSATHADVKFRVKSGSTPVNNAVVEAGGESLVTSSLGICSFQDLEIGSDYSWQVSREDYFSHSGTFTLNRDTTIEVQLRKSLASLTLELDEASRDAENAFAVLGGDTALFDGEGRCRFYKLPVDVSHDFIVESENYNDLEASVFLERDSTLVISLLVDGNRETVQTGSPLIWPVPASEVLNISMAAGYNTAEVFDLTGSLVLRSDLEKNGFRISVQSFQRGCYLIRLRSPLGEPAVHRFVVE